MAEKKTTKAPAKKNEVEVIQGEKELVVIPARTEQQCRELMRSGRQFRQIQAMSGDEATLKRVLSQSIDRYAAQWARDAKLPIDLATWVQAISNARDFRCIAGTRGGGHLVPFKNKETGFYEISWMPGYEVVAKVLLSHPEIIQIDAELVYENDVFEEEKGTTESLRHVPQRNPKKRGELIGVYALARFRDGASQHKFLDLDDLARHRASSSNQANWNRHFPEFARKSALISFGKFLMGSSDSFDEQVGRLVELEYSHANPDATTEAYDARGRKTREIAGASMIQELAQSRGAEEIEPEEPIDFPDAVPEERAEPSENRPDRRANRTIQRAGSVPKVDKTSSEESEVKQKYLACLREMRARKMATEDYESCPEEYLEDAIVDMEEQLAKVEEE